MNTFDPPYLSDNANRRMAESAYQIAREKGLLALTSTTDDPYRSAKSQDTEKENSMNGTSGLRSAPPVAYEPPRGMGWSDRLNAVIRAGRGLSGTSMVNLVSSAVEVLMHDQDITETRHRQLRKLHDVLTDQDNRMRVEFPDKTDRELGVLRNL